MQEWGNCIALNCQLSSCATTERRKIELRLDRKSDIHPFTFAKSMLSILFEADYNSNVRLFAVFGIFSSYLV